MSKLGTAAVSALAFALVLLMPATTLASGGFGYHLVWDYCGGTNGWTAYFKVRETASGTTSANRLTIDSWTQARDPGHPTWYRASTWPRVSTTFSADGTSHSLALRRHAIGGVDVGVRVVMQLRAWHNSTVLWSSTVRSVTC